MRAEWATKRLVLVAARAIKTKLDLLFRYPVNAERNHSTNTYQLTRQSHSPLRHSDSLLISTRRPAPALPPHPRLPPSAPWDRSPRTAHVAGRSWLSPTGSVPARLG